MIEIRTSRNQTQSDAGVSLIEVLVAMVVFSIIALGVGASLLTLVRMTEDTRSRLVASNLATSEIDLVRGLNDPFAAVNTTKTQSVSGTTFTVARSTSWVEFSGADVGCGSTGATMRSKRVNVTVTWQGMLTTTRPVRSDTLISPEDRINDPSLGTIRVSVLTPAGTGSPGVSVSVTRTSSGTGLAEQPPATDSDGCSYALKVPPGSYSVAISRAGSVDGKQIASPSMALEVAAGASVAAQFEYDYAATFNLAYASNYAGATPKLPENLVTSFVSTYGVFPQSGRSSQAVLAPVTSGYTAIAGKYAAPVTGNAGCLSVDPASWTEGTAAGANVAAGQRTPNVAAAPGGQANLGIGMGVVSVFTTADLYIFAVPATAPAAANAPGCAANTTYAFGKLTKGTNVLALPYGSWTFATSTSADGKSSAATIPVSSVSVLGTTPRPVAGSGVTTLDPRPPR